MVNLKSSVKVGDKVSDINGTFGIVTTGPASAGRVPVDTLPYGQPKRTWTRSIAVKFENLRIPAQSEVDAQINLLIDELDSTYDQSSVSAQIDWLQLVREGCEGGTTCAQPA